MKWYLIIWSLVMAVGYFMIALKNYEIGKITSDQNWPILGVCAILIGISVGIFLRLIWKGYP